MNSSVFYLSHWNFYSIILNSLHFLSFFFFWKFLTCFGVPGHPVVYHVIHTLIYQSLPLFSLLLRLLITHFITETKKKVQTTFETEYFGSSGYLGSSYLRYFCYGSVYYQFIDFWFLLSFRTFFGLLCVMYVSLLLCFPPTEE